MVPVEDTEQHRMRGRLEVAVGGRFQQHMLLRETNLPEPVDSQKSRRRPPLPQRLGVVAQCGGAVEATT
ncbi:hypothetical protein ACVH9Z_35710 [Rhodococcus opacus]|uniref:Uncharacterized protein n=2 Tax=Rhodococcus opacus TaxID=37919 RepID=A0AAX3YCD4_RHOOP|nr:hypothetical protein [Rhodococcus opacus]MCZ4587874.1 hypothetical protein [Rhodococcus opacus]UZG55207.1 hypothetical protein ONE62_35105 [Rhodococcus opacus]WLF47015.1 hypothetical protein Q5707_34980 [Rhodococcus opacus]